jgi:hypothetical protein
MLNLPAAHVDVAALEQYLGSQVASLRRGEGHVIIDLSTEDDDARDDDLEDVPDLATLSPVRVALLQGDMGPAYVACFWRCRQASWTRTTSSRRCRRAWRHRTPR